MEIKIRRLTKTAKIPTRGSAFAAGYDIYADISQPLHVQPGQIVKIPTGIMMEIPHGYFGAVYARSGLAVREGLRPANCTGIIDEDYRGEWMIILRNDSNEQRTIEPGERVAQLIIQKYYPVEFAETDALSETERGAGGFGSTGRK